MPGNTHLILNFVGARIFTFFLLVFFNYIVLAYYFIIEFRVFLSIQLEFICCFCFVCFLQSITVVPTHIDADTRDTREYITITITKNMHLKFLS